MAENISNIAGEHILSNSNLVVSNLRNSGPALPDLIIHSGGQVVSKSLTGYLRRAGRVPCWRVGNDNSLVDTFKLLTRFIPLQADVIYRALSDLEVPIKSSSYRDEWIRAEDKVKALTEDRLRNMPYSDTVVFNRILQNLPAGAILVPGNSSVIRYTQLFPADGSVMYYANRGVSGIDGTVSTASGIAFASKKLTLVLCGDLGFLYDSNALWNRDLPAGLRIVVINNGGGGIFHILKGPSELPGFKKYIEASHPVNTGDLANAYGLDYWHAEDESALQDQWQSFLDGRGRAGILELKTDPVVSATAFRQLMGTLR